MGGGDLNLKKSWHPLLIKNQERVWKEERKAIDEKKKSDQLRKELIEERQIEELQRMGGKSNNRVDWLYAAPASGSGQNDEELEQYLLGKKSVEQLFREKDRKKMEAMASSTSAATSGQTVTPGNFQALGGNANSARDLASKIREDPLLAIKRQEQKAYEELMKNPKRLKELRDAREAATPRDQKKEKKHKHRHREEDDQDREERKRRKHERRAGEEMDRPPARKCSRSRSPPPRQRSRSPPRHRRPEYDDRPPRRYEAPALAASGPSAEERLAAMQASAAQLHSSREERLAKQEVEDRHAAALEDKERLARKVKGGAMLDPKFIKEQEKQMWNRKIEGRA